MRRRTFLQVAAAGVARAATGGPPLLYMGALPNQVLIFDEDQEKIVDKIQIHTGAPRRLQYSYDRKRIYISTPLKTGIEVFDLATRKMVNHFVLSEGNRRVQLFGFTPDPEDRLLYGSARVAIKQADRFELEKIKLVVIDLAQQKIVRSVEMPMADGRPAAQGEYRLSPDGKHLYSFGDTVRIFDTADFKQVDTIELSRPLFPGMERVNMQLRDDPNESRSTVTGIFNSTDPVVHRSIFGIARFDLAKRTFDFTPVGPASAAGIMGLRLAPDGKTGYSVIFQGDVGNRRCEFWVLDMGTRKVTSRVEFDGPVNFNYTVSGSGKQIYVHGSSPFIEVYDIATLKRRKVIDTAADLMGGILVAPRAG